ncbi:CmcJ/NvfI family oxidoreductase [Bradyrhizobium sp. BEA-2-5]|uniref:CmcJ/NvfI family oxidoreductase n=1 Tax=Bradyrhizobium sp. BEA-2-5 TaxID=3080015 RepID=UPI00293F001B|nr:CmcJ/NvfI family oxidoreductase [Bradyrhizobium sp. BEA-2-5]WOH80391.1 CmcJ/NvfI family oxidoreductase [Bradyrhizobium sp. BEA-2-5]
MQLSSRARVERYQLESVEGRIAFARRSHGEKASEVLVASSDVPMVSYDVTIRNAHPIVDELSLDKEGFTFIQRKLSCAKERDPQKIRERYLEEMVPFIKDYFNASWVVPKRDAVILRSSGGDSAPSATEKDDGFVRAYVAGFAHIDYAPIAGPVMAAREEQLRGNPIRAYSRLMIIQTWHALSEPPQDFPLAFCDGSSVVDTDLVESLYDRYNVRHKTWLLHYSPLYRWYYFPEMSAGEFLLFKGYDSDDNHNPRSAHAAFDNRRTYPNAKPRKSIEARFFVYCE